MKEGEGQDLRVRRRGNNKEFIQRELGLFKNSKSTETPPRETQTQSCNFKKKGKNGSKFLSHEKSFPFHICFFDFVCSPHPSLQTQVLLPFLPFFSSPKLTSQTTLPSPEKLSPFLVFAERK